MQSRVPADHIKHPLVVRTARDGTLICFPTKQQLIMAMLLVSFRSVLSVVLRMQEECIACNVFPAAQCGEVTSDAGLYATRKDEHPLDLLCTM